MKRWVAARYMGIITAGLELGDREWLGACCAIQWLGTEEGQEFLVYVQNAGL